MTIKLALADDHAIVRQGLKAILEATPDFSLVGEADNGQDTFPMIEKSEPQVLILDLMLPGLNGLDVTKNVLRRWPDLKVVILSMHTDLSYVSEAMKAGAMAYVVKGAAADELIKAIRSVVEGKKYLSPPLTEQAVEDYKKMAGNTTGARHEMLTPREREVLQLTVEGLTCTDISTKLFISARTVETHRSNLMRKLGVRNQKELVRYAVQHNLLPQAV